ncbi:Imm43 family immunity protein [Capnocytophaga canimorsus]|uniref:Imm43 family immunity protein n=1 Tax=Capnocytophaga canimorsus TaxID=28188 RepID=UPI00374313AF
MAKIKSVVNRSGKELETKPYYVLRFYQFDDDLLEYPLEGAVYGKGTKGKKIYPNMKPKQDNPKKIYVLKERPYHKTFILTQQVKDEIIRRKFIGPKIYSTQEYIQAYNGYK